MADALLIGYPNVFVLGSKGETGMVELQRRPYGEEGTTTQFMSFEEATRHMADTAPQWDDR